jgi:hypothetical protein
MATPLHDPEVLAVAAAMPPLAGVLGAEPNLRKIPDFNPAVSKSKQWPAASPLYQDIFPQLDDSVPLECLAGPPITPADLAPPIQPPIIYTPLTFTDLVDPPSRPQDPVTDPWSMDLDDQEWRNLTDRSRYFAAVKEHYKSHPVIDGASDIYVHSMFVPQAVPRHLFSECVSFAENTKPATHVADNVDTELPHPDDTELPGHVIAMNLFHLFTIIQMLARAESGCYYPTMSLFTDCLHSLTHIGLILDSKFLFKYAAKHLITGNNVLIFAKTILKTFPGEIDYGWSASLVAEAFGNVARMNPDLFDYLRTFHSSPAQQQALTRRICKSVGSNNARFWRNQPNLVRCNFCHKAISRTESILSVTANVQVLPCCYSLAHYTCFQSFLLRSVACDHDCSDVQSCVALLPPMEIRHFNFTICPACDASYIKGRCSCDDELNAIVVAKRERLRYANEYNGFDYKSRPEIHLYVAVQNVLDNTT